MNILNDTPQSKIAPYHGLDTRDVFNVLRRGGLFPVAGNTASFLPLPSLESEAVTVIQNVFAPLKAFTSIFSPDEFAPKSTREIKFVESASTTQTNPTDFQPADGSTVGAIPVAVSHYSQPWPVSSGDLQSGLRQLDLFTANASALAATLAGQLAALFTVANFPKTPIVSAGAAFGLGDAATAYSRIGKATRKSLLLDSEQFAQLAHQSPRGFQSGDAVHGWAGIYETSAGWTSAGAKVHGLACAPQSVAIVSGLLHYSMARPVSRKLIGLPGLDLAIEWNSWFHTATRTTWNSLDVIFGAGVADPQAAVLIQTP